MGVGRITIEESLFYYATQERKLIQSLFSIIKTIEKFMICAYFANKMKIYLMEIVTEQDLY